MTFGYIAICGLIAITGAFIILGIGELEEKLDELIARLKEIALIVLSVYKLEEKLGEILAKLKEKP